MSALLLGVLVAVLLDTRHVHGSVNNPVLNVDTEESSPGAWKSADQSDYIFLGSYAAVGNDENWYPALCQAALHAFTTSQLASQLTQPPVLTDKIWTMFFVDTCPDVGGASCSTLRALREITKLTYEDGSDWFPPVSAVIGGSQFTQEVAQLASAAPVLNVGFADKSHVFYDFGTYPYFIRVNPSDTSFWSTVITVLEHMKYKLANLWHSVDAPGQSALIAASDIASAADLRLLVQAVKDGSNTGYAVGAEWPALMVKVHVENAHVNLNAVFDSAPNYDFLHWLGTQGIVGRGYLWVGIMPDMDAYKQYLKLVLYDLPVAGNPTPFAKVAPFDGYVALTDTIDPSAFDDVFIPWFVSLKSTKTDVFPQWILDTFPTNIWSEDGAAAFFGHALAPFLFDALWSTLLTINSLATKGNPYDSEDIRKKMKQLNFEGFTGKVGFEGKNSVERKNQYTIHNNQACTSPEYLQMTYRGPKAATTVQKLMAPLLEDGEYKQLDRRRRLSDRLVNVIGKGLAGGLSQHSSPEQNTEACLMDPVCSNVVLKVLSGGMLSPGDQAMAKQVLGADAVREFVRGVRGARRLNGTLNDSNSTNGDLNDLNDLNDHSDSNSTNGTNGTNGTSARGRSQSYDGLVIEVPQRVAIMISSKVSGLIAELITSQQTVAIGDATASCVKDAMPSSITIAPLGSFASESMDVDVSILGMEENQVEPLLEDLEGAKENIRACVVDAIRAIEAISDAVPLNGRRLTVQGGGDVNAIGVKAFSIEVVQVRWSDLLSAEVTVYAIGKGYPIPGTWYTIGNYQMGEANGGFLWDHPLVVAECGFHIPPREDLACFPGSHYDRTHGRCATCTMGTFTDEAGRSECKACQPGTYGDQDGMDQCTVCPFGAYTGVESQTECEICPVGTYQDAVSSSACRDCSPGTYSNVPGADSCEVCQPAFYADELKSTACTACDVDKESEYPGASEKGMCRCRAGLYSDTRDSPCYPCLEGMICPYGANTNDWERYLEDPAAVEAEGDVAAWPLLRPKFYSAANTPLSVFECRDDTHCPGGNPDTCGSDLTGRACATCPDKHYWDGRECASCRTWESTLFMFPVLPIFLMSLVLLFMHRVFTDDVKAWGSWRNSIFCLSFILLNHVQVLNLLGTTNVIFPVAMGYTVGMSGEGDANNEWTVSRVFRSSNNMMALFKISCQGFTSFEAQLGLMLSAPLMLACWCFLLVALSRLLSAAMLGDRWVNFQPLQPDRMFNVFMAIVFTFFCSLASVSLIVFKCQWNPNGEYTLSSDLTIDCYESGPWTNALFPSLTAVWLYCVCFVGMLAWIVWQAPKRFQDPGFQIRWKFVFIKYRPDVWWWGLVFVAKNFSINFAFCVFREPTGQLYWIIGSLLAYMLTGITWQPYRVPVATLCEVSSCIALIFVASIITNFCPRGEGYETLSFLGGTLCFLPGFLWIVMSIQTLYERFVKKPDTDSQKAAAHTMLGPLREAASFLLGMKDTELGFFYFNTMSSYDRLTVQRTVSLIESELMGFSHNRLVIEGGFSESDRKSLVDSVQSASTRRSQNGMSQEAQNEAVEPEAQNEAVEMASPEDDAHTHMDDERGLANAPPQFQLAFV